jgi:hypothetical protein
VGDYLMVSSANVLLSTGGVEKIAESMAKRGDSIYNICEIDLVMPTLIEYDTLQVEKMGTIDNIHEVKALELFQY